MKITKEIDADNLFYLYKRPYDVLTEEAVKESVEYIKRYKNSAMFADHGWWDIALYKRTSLRVWSLQRHFFKLFF